MGRNKAGLNTKLERFAWAFLVVLMLAASSSAQVEVGEDLKLSLNGAIGTGYGAGWGDTIASTHALNLNGIANLSGSYYNPQFLSFSVQPFYNRSQNNSTTQSIFDSTGVTATANLFGGSKFPGWVSYSRTSEGSSELGIPGLTGLATEGSSQAFSVGWSVLLPKYPTLSASFTSGSSSSVLLGTADSTAQTSTKTFNLSSSYLLKGWSMTGFLNHQNLSLEFPDVLGFTTTESGSSSTGFGVSATHKIPLSGSFGVGWSRSSFSSEGNTGSDGTSNNFSAGATIAPLKRLTLSGDFRYISNELVNLRQSLLSGADLLLLPLVNSSSSMAFGGTATYSIGHGLALRGYATHRIQSYAGRDVSDNIFGASITYNYARPLFGMLHFTLGLVDVANQEGNSNLGLVAGVGLNRRFGRWDLSADISYSQSVQTLVSMYTTSNYTFGGNIRRKINSTTYWNGSFRGARSALTQVDGQENASYAVTTGITWRRYGMNVGYATSNGTTVLGVNGLLTPTPGIGFITNDIVLYNGTSYSASLFCSPIRKLTISASWVKARSDTASNTVVSLNQTEMLTGRMEYHLRKLNVIAGFTRYQQGISAAGVPPSMVNSYSIGISRWFNVF